MKKIAFSTKLSAYVASMALSAVVFGSYNLLAPVPVDHVPEIPIINLNTISPNIQVASPIKGDNPFGKISMAGAGIAKAGMEPGMVAPTPPQVPPMPGVEGNIGSNYKGPSMELSVLGVLPPDVVILSRGGKTVTAQSGNRTEFGTVGEVTAQGAYIDGTFISLK